ncbi:MAG: MFS transporter [Alphaproteobacteria bacterium]|nr:MFS transporter [Alphaproteobacteria bacterium]
MFERNIPEFVRHAPTPSVHGFATLTGVEAIARGSLVSVFPLEMYKVLKDAQAVSEMYFLIGCISLLFGLLVPAISRKLSRRWTYSLGALMMFLGPGLAASGHPYGVVLGLMLTTFATVTLFVCLNAYVLDYVKRHDFGRCETLRMFYSAVGWTLGPVVGVMLWDWWRPFPFFISMTAAVVLMIIFWVMRLGNGKLIVRVSTPTINPLAYLGRFFRQKRLVAGWIFAVTRSCGWWVYVVYLPIYALENGLGSSLGGLLLSLTNSALFITPLMLYLLRRMGVKRAVRSGFLWSGMLFTLAGFIGDFPLVAICLLLAGSFAMIFLDICGGLPFLMAVKPSDRNEMSAVYSSFRDVSAIVTPGASAVVLLFAPLSTVFAFGGSLLLVSWMIAAKLNPRLGDVRSRA